LRPVANPAGPRFTDRYRLDRYDMAKGLPQRFGDRFLAAATDSSLRAPALSRYYSHSARGTWNGGTGYKLFHPVESRNFPSP
jgi:hypothetical protein